MDKVKVSLKKARATFRLRPGAPLDVEKLRKTIVKAGFTPTWVVFEAVGQLMETDGRAGLKVKGSGQVIPLERTERLAELRRKGRGKEVTVKARIPAKKRSARIEAVRAR